MSEMGKINAFNPDTGAFLGPLADSNNNEIVIPGLWELSFGKSVDTSIPAFELRCSFQDLGPIIESSESHSIRKNA